MTTQPLQIIPIVIFGAALRADGKARSVLYKRVGWALRCGKNISESPTRKVVYIPTGGATAARFGFSVTESAYMVQCLEDGFVRNSFILPDHHALNTMQSVKAVSALLSRLEQDFVVEKPVLVTSLYHVWRCRLLMKCAGWATTSSSPPGPTALHWKKRWFWRLREGVALLYDGFFAPFLLANIRMKKTIAPL